jgi:hypothetical protein
MIDGRLPNGPSLIQKKMYSIGNERIFFTVDLLLALKLPKLRRSKKNYFQSIEMCEQGKLSSINVVIVPI